MKLIVAPLIIGIFSSCNTLPKKQTSLKDAEFPCPDSWAPTSIEANLTRHLFDVHFDQSWHSLDSTGTCAQICEDMEECKTFTHYQPSEGPIKFSSASNGCTFLTSTQVFSAINRNTSCVKPLGHQASHPPLTANLFNSIDYKPNMRLTGQPIAIVRNGFYNADSNPFNWVTYCRKICSQTYANERSCEKILVGKLNGCILLDGSTAPFEMNDVFKSIWFNHKWTDKNPDRFTISKILVKPSL